MYPKYSSEHLKCCNKTIHKSCLLKWAITKQTNELTCPFCRAHIVDIFEYISLAQISQMLVDWKCDHNIIVRGKNTQIMIDSNPVDLINRTNEAELIEEMELREQSAPRTLPVRSQSTANTTATPANSDKGVFWCLFGSLVVIIAIMIIIITMTHTA